MSGKFYVSSLEKRVNAMSKNAEEIKREHEKRLDDIQEKINAVTEVCNKLAVLVGKIVESLEADRHKGPRRRDENVIFLNENAHKHEKEKEDNKKNGEKDEKKK